MGHSGGAKPATPDPFGAASPPQPRPVGVVAWQLLLQHCGGIVPARALVKRLATAATTMATVHAHERLKGSYGLEQSPKLEVEASPLRLRTQLFCGLMGLVPPDMAPSVECSSAVLRPQTARGTLPARPAATHFILDDRGAHYPSRRRARPLSSLAGRSSRGTLLRRAPRWPARAVHSSKRDFPSRCFPCHSEQSRPPSPTTTPSLHEATENGHAHPDQHHQHHA